MATTVCTHKLLYNYQYINTLDFFDIFIGPVHRSFIQKQKKTERF